MFILIHSDGYIGPFESEAQARQFALKALDEEVRFVIERLESPANYT